MTPRIFVAARTFSTAVCFLTGLLWLREANSSALTLRGQVTLEKPGASITVAVWPLGEALAANAKLGEAPVARAQADSGAPFVLDLPQTVPPFTVEVQARGHVGASYLVTLPEEATLPPVWLPAGQELVVRVTRDGKPEPGARVDSSVMRVGSVESGFGIWSPVMPSGPTDTNGELHCSVPAAGRVSAVGVASDGRWGRVYRTLPAGGSVELKLDSHALAVAVQDARGEGVAGVEVAAQDAPLGAAGRTGSDGKATVQVPSDREGQVVALGDTVVGRALVRPDTPGGVVIKVAPRETIAVTWTGPARALLWPSWMPLALDRLRLRWATGGRCQLPWLGSGGTLQAWSPGWAQAELPARSNDTALALVLSQAVQVEGTVVDAEKRPLAGIPVWAYVPRSRTVNPSLGRRPEMMARPLLAWGVSDAHGHFAVPPLAPGSVRLQATRAGYPPAQHGPAEAAAGSRATVTLTFQPGTSLGVQVRESTSRPLAGVDVRAFARDADESTHVSRPRASELAVEEAAAASSTDAEGKATLTGLAPGKAWVLLRLPGFVPRVLEAAIPREGLDLGVQTLEPGIDLAVRVVDEAGKGLADAELRVSTTAAESGALLGRSGADGRCTVADQPRTGELYLAAYLKGYVMTAPQKVTLPPEGDVVVRLQKALTLAGKLVDADTQQPIADARVSAGVLMELTIGTSRSANMRGGSTARSDERGEFRLEGLPRADLTLSTSAEGYQSHEQTVWMPAEGEPQALTVALKKGLELHGRVLDPSGQPAPGVRVTAKGDIDITQRMMWNGGGARTGPDGAFSIQGLSPGKLEVLAETDDGAMAKTLAEPGSAEVVLRLEPPGTVQGHLRGPQGVALGGLRVRLFGSSTGPGEALTDDGGAFAVDKVVAGTYHAIVQGHVLVGGAPEVKVEAGRTSTVELQLESTGTLVGTVRGLSATELEACQVSGGGDGARPGPDGAFRVENVRAGHVVLTASVGMAGRERSIGVDLKAGETVTVEIDFKEGVTVAGHVSRPGGAAAGLLVVVTGAGGSGTDATDPDGSFAVKGIPTGQTTVEVNDAQGRLLLTRTLMVEADTTLELEIAQGLLNGRVLAAKDQTPIAGATVTVRQEGGREPLERTSSTDGSGAFTVAELPGGSYRVTASAPSYNSAETTFTVGEGVSEVTLSLEPETGVDLLVRRADGSAVGEVTVILFRGETLVLERQLRLDAGGRGRLAGAAPGTYQALFAGWASTAMTMLEVPGPAATVTLREGGSIEVVTPPAAGKAPWKVRVTDLGSGLGVPIFLPHAFALRLGWVEVPEGRASPAMCGGTCLVEAQDPGGGLHQQTVTVAPHGTSLVRFE